MIEKGLMPTVGRLDLGVDWNLEVGSGKGMIECSMVDYYNVYKGVNRGVV